MTTVNRPIRRESSTLKYSRGKARPLIIEIAPPGDKITLRLKGERRRWTVALAEVLALAVRAEAAAKREARALKRKRK